MTLDDRRGGGDTGHVDGGLPRSTMARTMFCSLLGRKCIGRSQELPCLWLRSLGPWPDLDAGSSHAVFPHGGLRVGPSTPFALCGERPRCHSLFGARTVSSTRQEREGEWPGLGEIGKWEEPNHEESTLSPSPPGKTKVEALLAFYLVGAQILKFPNFAATTTSHTPLNCRVRVEGVAAGIWRQSKAHTTHTHLPHHQHGVGHHPQPARQDPCPD